MKLKTNIVDNQLKFSSIIQKKGVTEIAVQHFFVGRGGHMPNQKNGKRKGKKTKQGDGRCAGSDTEVLVQK